MAAKDELSPTGLERATYVQPGWSHVDTLLKVAGLIDTNLDGLRDGDVLIYHAASGKYRARRKK
jgi:hypothetical protein